MNSNIAKNNVTDSSGGIKAHQAYAMEFSRMKKAKTNCENGNCFDYNKMGGDARYHELNNINKQERTKDELRRKTQKDTHPENMYNDEQSATEKAINVSSLSSDSKHRTTINKQIMSNNEALSEEISEIRYLIEYINNNKKIKI